jgi:gluconokinase
MSSDNLQHIWVVTGPAGSGKSTVGIHLHQQLGVPFLEGDDVSLSLSIYKSTLSATHDKELTQGQFHPASNKAKMGSGIPLTDADRWDWLIALRNAATTLLTPTSPSTPAPRGVVVACSALKEKYRDVMRLAAYGTPNVRIHFVYLKLDRSTLFARVSARQAHYMKPGMVESQLKDLEEPGSAEWDVITVDVHAEAAVVQKDVMTAVQSVLAGYETGASL